MMDEDLLKRQDVADRLGLSLCTVGRLIARGDLRAVKVGVRGVRIPASAYAEYLERIQTADLTEIGRTNSTEVK